MEKTRAELFELERLGYISLTGETITVSYRGYHWKLDILLSVTRYLGRSILTPIIVTLITIWVTWRLGWPA